MALQNLPGAKQLYLGPNLLGNILLPAYTTATTLDAANEATMWIGHCETSDGGSHTINTSGSSSIQWRSGAVTFASGSTIMKVGVADVLTTAGPPGRAVHSSDIITFDVVASITGGGGGITASGWQTSVPTSGTKTIANGDLIAVAIQMTARGGTDSIVANHTQSAAASHRPIATSFTGGAYAAVVGIPPVLLNFSDGALGWIHGSDVAAARTTLSFNSAGSPKEYGQLFELPFPLKIYGIYGWYLGADVDLVLYSDPLGTPVAEKTVSVDASTITSAVGVRGFFYFSSPYDYAAGDQIVVAFKPAATTMNAYTKTYDNAAHRITDPWGTSGFGVSRDAGAFANINSSLNQVYIGLIVGAFDDGVSVGGGGLKIVGTGGLAG